MQSSQWLWIYGPSGAGKTAVGYEVFRRLAVDLRTAYVEIDQLGMCAPMPSEDLVHLKAENLLSMLDGFGAAGADAVVVSGDIAGPAMHDVSQRCAASPLLCRLTASDVTLEKRLRQRGAPDAYAAAAREYDRLPGVPAGDITIDTSEHSIAEVAELVARRARDELGIRPRPRSESTPHAPVDCDHVLLVCGPRAVGKSAVAWEVFMATASDDMRVAFVDLAQVGSMRPAPSDDPNGHRLKAMNVARLWENFAREGARRLVLCGEIDNSRDVARYREILGGSAVTIALLTASEGTLLERALARAEGSGPELPGDTLRGATEADLRRIAAAGVRRADELAGFADVVIGTDGLSVSEVAAGLLS